MNKINDKNSINFLRSDTQQKIIAFANEVGTSPGALLNTLIDDEIERHRLLKIFNELNKEDMHYMLNEHNAHNNPKQQNTPTQSLTIVICLSLIYSICTISIINRLGSICVA